MKDSISRRNFLKSGAMTLLAFPELARLASIKVHHIPLHDAGIQHLLTQSPAATLAALADTGFKELEYTGGSTASYYGLKPEEFRRLLDDSPISMPIGQAKLLKTHWIPGQKEASDEWKKTMENALTVGQEYLISPGFDWDLSKPDDLKRGIEAYNRIGELMEEAGLRLGFRATDREFEVKQQGRPAYEYLLRQLDSLYVCQQLDLGLLAKLGLDPVVWLRINPHHFESLHVQDYAKAAQTAPALGRGTLPLDDILAFARKNTPIKYWVIKSELPASETPWPAVRNDLQRFREYGFV